MDGGLQASSTQGSCGEDTAATNCGEGNPQSAIKALSDRQFHVLAACAIVLAGLLAYANSFANRFVWDDVSSVQANRHIQDPAFFFQLFREDQHPFGRGQGNFYRPLLAASFMLDFQLAHGPTPSNDASAPLPEVNPFLFHLTSTAWHIGAALLLLALLSALDAPRFVRAAVPLVYVVHPLHTEAITYISGRADAMSAVFIYAALWFALWESSRGKRVAGALLGGAAFCCGLMSKESATAFPLLLLLFTLGRPAERTNRARIYAARSVPLIVSAAILGIYIALRMTVLHFGSSRPPASALMPRLVETCQSFALYLRLLFVPTGLHMERSLEHATATTAYAGALLLAGIAALMAWSFLRGRHRVGLGLAWFLATWLPISGVFPLNAPMAEHWLYVPMAGFLWALAEILAALYDRAGARWIPWAAAYAACVCFIAMTAVRNRDWRDNESIFRATLAYSPQSARVHYNLAVTYGDILKNIPGARRHYEEVVSIYNGEKQRGLRKMNEFWDEELESHYSLAEIYFDEQRYDAAMEHYGTLLRITPDEKNKERVAQAALGMARCCAAVGDNQHANEFLQKALSLQPELRNAVQGKPAA